MIKLISFYVKKNFVLSLLEKGFVVQMLNC